MYDDEWCVIWAARKKEEKKDKMHFEYCVILVVMYASARPRARVKRTRGNDIFRSKKQHFSGDGADGATYTDQLISTKNSCNRNDALFRLPFFSLSLFFFFHFHAWQISSLVVRSDDKDSFVYIRECTYTISPAKEFEKFLNVFRSAVVVVQVCLSRDFQRRPTNYFYNILSIPDTETRLA